MPGSEAAGIPSEFYVNISGGANNNGDGTFIQNRQTWQYTDFLSYVRGKHSISVGGDFRKEAVNRIEDYFTDPIFNFSGQYSDPNQLEGGNGTTALADMLLGLPNYFNLQTEVRSDLRHTAMDLYVQDNYKVNRHLTVDAGFRWEPFLPPVDNLNDQICFDPTFKTQSTFYVPRASAVFEGGWAWRSGLPALHGSQPHEERGSAPRLQHRSFCQRQDVNPRRLRHLLGSGSPDCLEPLLDRATV
jgi:outer membrane receptor protein involved in Fe transport